MLSNKRLKEIAEQSWEHSPTFEEMREMARRLLETNHELAALRELKRQLLETDHCVGPDLETDTTLERVKWLCNQYAAPSAAEDQPK